LEASALNPLSKGRRAVNWKIVERKRYIIKIKQ